MQLTHKDYYRHYYLTYSLIIVSIMSTFAIQVQTPTKFGIITTDCDESK